MRACLNLYIIKVMATIFSRIIAGEIPSYKVAEDDKFFAFLDINPLVKGHTLVVPKQEVDYIFDLDDEDLAAMHVFAKKVARAIEKAFREGKTDFYKPVSCHLYPIRIGDYGPYKAVNYHRWDVCKAAVLLGRKEDVPVYKFLKEPLIRKFGEEWYAELELAAGEMKKQGML